MLPDFPEIKKHLRKEFLLTIEKEMRENGLLSEIAVHEAHEGNAFKLTSADGFLQEGEYKELSSRFEISREEMISKGPEAYLDRAVQIARDMGGQREKQIFEKMNKITEITGNVVNAESKPLSPDLILSALDKIAIDFDEFGNPIMPTLVLRPEQFEKIKNKIPKWESDPNVIEKKKRIIERKRKEWIDRESNRKLVD